MFSVHYLYPFFKNILFVCFAFYASQLLQFTKLTISSFETD